MQKGITPIIAVILLLLITISIAGFAFMFFGRAAETAGGQVETELEKQTSAIGENFVVESVDNNKVYIRNLGTQELDNLNFYVNGVKVDSSGTVPAGQAAMITLNDAQLAQLPNDAKLKVTSLGASREENTKFYKEEVAGYWKFDEADRTAVTDYSGNGNDGTFYGETWRDGDLKPACPDCPAVAAGKYGNALSFDGTEDYIAAGDSPYLNFGTGDFTISAWFKTSSDGMLVNKKSDAGETPAGYGIGVQSGGIQVLLADGMNWLNEGGAYAVRGSGLNNNNWHHVAVTYDRTVSKTAKVYVDGVQQGSNINLAGVTGPSSNGELFLVGKRVGWNWFGGAIDEVRVYRRALTQQEITDDMNSPYPVIRPAASYSFGKIEGSKALDTHNIVAGRFGAAMSFDGVDDYVNCGASTKLDLANIGTVEAWINAVSYTTDTYPSVIGKGASAGWDTPGYALWLYSDVNIRGEITSSVGVRNEALFGKPSAGAWHHLAFRWDGTYLKAYVDGQQYGSNVAQTLNANPAGRTCFIGKSEIGSNYFKGTIDEVRIMNIARPM